KQPQPQSQQEIQQHGDQGYPAGQQYIPAGGQPGKRPPDKQDQYQPGEYHMNMLMVKMIRAPRAAPMMYQRRIPVCVLATCRCSQLLREARPVYILSVT